MKYIRIINFVFAYITEAKSLFLIFVTTAYSLHGVSVHFPNFGWYSLRKYECVEA